MIRILIIEDEKLASDKLILLLDSFNESIEILGVCRSVEESSFFLKNNSPDLIFCDIHLSDGLAFNIFEQLDLKIPIIFTTAYDEYALKAFEEHSIDYLLKPIELDALKRSLQKYHEMTAPVDIKNLINEFKVAKKSYKQRFLIQTGRNYQSISVDDIAFLYSMEKGSFIRTIQGKDFPLDFSLSYALEKLDPVQFFRVNRKAIVRFSCVKHIHRFSKRKFILHTEPKPPFELVVPEERLKSLKQWLDR